MSAGAVQQSPARWPPFGAFALVSRVSSVQVVQLVRATCGDAVLVSGSVDRGFWLRFWLRFSALAASGVRASEVRDRDEIHIPGRIGVRVVHTDVGFARNFECDLADLVLGLTREIRNRDARSLPGFIADLGDEGSRHAPRPLARRFAFDPRCERVNVSERHYSDGDLV